MDPLSLINLERCLFYIQCNIVYINAVLNFTCIFLFFVIFWLAFLMWAPVRYKSYWLWVRRVPESPESTQSVECLCGSAIAWPLLTFELQLCMGWMKHRAALNVEIIKQDLNVEIMKIVYLLCLSFEVVVFWPSF